MGKLQKLLNLAVSFVKLSITIYRRLATRPKSVLMNAKKQVNLICYLIVVVMLFQDLFLCRCQCQDEYCHEA